MFGNILPGLLPSTVVYMVGIWYYIVVYIGYNLIRYRRKADKDIFSQGGDYTRSTP